MSEAQPQIAGLVLAGGRSSRLGQDKALLLANGIPLVAWQYAILERLVAPVYVVQAARQRFEVALPTLIDDIPDVGPMGGITRGLEFLAAGAAFVCATDMPLLRPSFVSGLCNLLGDADLAIPERDGHLEPLCAIYSTRCLPALKALLAAGDHRLHAIVSRVHARRVPEAIWRQWDEHGVSFLNINTPEDLATVQRVGREFGIVLATAQDDEKAG